MIADDSAVFISFLRDLPFSRCSCHFVMPDADVRVSKYSNMCFSLLTAQSQEKKRERRERLPDDDAPNPYGCFILAENLMDKIKLLDYDDNFCKAKQIKPIPRFA